MPFCALVVFGFFASDIMYFLSWFPKYMSHVFALFAATSDTYMNPTQDNGLVTTI